LIVIDLDNFKAVNDRDGHKEGDRCLDIDLLGKAISRKGKLYRFREGDEFAVVLRNTVTQEASATAERIRKSITESMSKFGVTASVGVAWK
jgi:diguanylate cyclase (GGDEF)-like protein